MQHNGVRLASSRWLGAKGKFVASGCHPASWAQEGRRIQPAMGFDAARLVEQARALAEVEHALELVALGVGLGECQFVSRDEEGREFAECRGLDPDQAFATVGFEGHQRSPGHPPVVRKPAAQRDRLDAFNRRHADAEVNGVTPHCPLYPVSESPGHSRSTSEKTASESTFRE